MANPFIEFVKKYQKDNNIKSYKEAITKASKEYKKQKDSASKPDTKKAKGLRMEITEKKKEKTARGKGATKQQKDEDTENLIRKQSGELIKKHNKDLEKGDITNDEHKDLVSKVRDTAEKAIKDKEKHLKSLNDLLRGGGLNVVEVKPDEIQKMSKSDRAKILRKYKKVRKSVMDDIAKGDKPSDLEEFRKLGNRLKGTSTKNSYAKDLKAVDRKINSKTFQKKNKAKEIKEEMKGKKAPPKGKSETQFKKEQDLMNRIKKLTASNIAEARRKFEKGEIDEAQYVALIKKIPEEVERIEKQREAQVRAIRGLTGKGARTVEDQVREALAITGTGTGTGTGSSAVSTALPTTAPDQLARLRSTERSFVDRIRTAVDANNLNALGNVLKASGAVRLTNSSRNRSIARLERINTKANGALDALLDRVRNIPLSDIVPPADSRRGIAVAGPPQTVAEVLPADAPALDPTIPEPVEEPAVVGETQRRVRMRNAERIHSKLHATVFAILHGGGVANFNQSLNMVEDLFNQFNADESFVSNENRRVVNDSGIPAETYISITQQEIDQDIDHYIPSVISDGIFEVRTEPSAIFTEYDRRFNNSSVLNIYRNGNAVSGFSARALHIPQDCLVDVSGEFAGNEEAQLIEYNRASNSIGVNTYRLNPNGTIMLDPNTAQSYVNAGGDPDTLPQVQEPTDDPQAQPAEPTADDDLDLDPEKPVKPPKPSAKRLAELEASRKGVFKHGIPFEGADPEVETPADTQKRLKQSHLTDFYQRNNPQPDETVAEDIADDGSVPQKAGSKGIKFKVKKQPTKNKDGSVRKPYGSSEPAQASKFVRGIAKQGEEFSQKQKDFDARVPDVFGAESDAPTEDSYDPHEDDDLNYPDADDIPKGGSLAFKTITPQSSKPDELFNKTELTQLGGAGLVSNIHDRMMGVSKIWNKLTGKAQVKTVKGVDDKDKIERDITKQTYIEPAKRNTNIKGFQYQPNLSDPEMAVYKNRNTNELVIGHRGSSNMDDVKTDLRLAVGGIKRTDRYKRDKDKVESALRANPDSKVVFTGHSLGGTQAIEMLRNHPNGRAVVFNAGHTPFRDGSVKHDDITYYTKKGDAVSMLGANAYKNVKYLDDDDKGNFISNHLMSNFDDKENKNPEQPEPTGGALLEGYNVPNATGIAGAGLSDVKKMRKHLENIRKAEDTPEKVLHLNRLMKDANSVGHPKLRSDMLKVAGGILETL